MGNLPESLHTDFIKGINEFNQRQFFDCHETLEDVWREYLETDRELIQGLIQIAVAYYHLGRNNLLGAKKLFHRGLPRLKKYGEGHFGLELKKFVHKVEEDCFMVENADSFDQNKLNVPIIEIIGPSSDC